MKKKLQRPRNACFDANDSLPVTQMCKKYREKTLKIIKMAMYVIHGLKNLEY